MLTLADVKLHLRVTHDDDDVLIQSLIGAAVERIEHHTGRRLSEGSHCLVLDGFPPGVVRLPEVPVIAIDTIKYSVDGVEQLASENLYRLDTRETLAAVHPVGSWPIAQGPASVTITYTAGHKTIPSSIRRALLMIIASGYELAENHIIGVTASEVPMAATWWLQPYVVHRFA